MRAHRLFLLLALSCAPAFSDALLDTAYRQMYNLDFDTAHRTLAQYQREHPKDPFGAVSDAAAWLFGEFERLHVLRSEFALDDQNFSTSSRALPADPEATRKFEEALEKTRQLAQTGLEESPPDPNAELAETLRLGLHADYLALIQKRELPALSEIKQARSEAGRLLAAHPEYYDAWIAVALENYLLSLKPAPVRWLLRATGSQTDRQTGLEKLRLTADKGHYLAPYARLLLAVAELRDHQPAMARRYLGVLAEEFPANPLYREELARIR